MMRVLSIVQALIAGCLLVIPTTQLAEAQAASGSPSATTTVNGLQLPPPPPFGGEIGTDANASTPWWAPRVVPPEEAPNVLLIITDDSGRAKLDLLKARMIAA